MMMDLYTALVCVGFVVISAAILLFISMVVTKEKSYEEAIAEQRQQTSMLLGTQNKSKLKDKKQKKAGKKVKEKLQSMLNDADAADDSENPETVTAETNDAPATSSNSQTKHHVEFKEPQVLDEPIKEITKQKEEAAKQEPAVVKEKPAKQQKQNADNETKANKKAVKHQTNEIIAQNSVEKEEPVVEQVSVVNVVPQTNVAPQTNGVVSGANGGKDKKKKKSEQNAIHQLADDKQGINLQILTTLVRKAELTRSEVQILIDMLLNKQHEAPTVIDEWSEGKADPVQKLKKQLAEKEKLLLQEQEALTGAQAKLKEVRAEQLAERSQLQQKARGLEEALNAKQLELQAVNNRTQGLNQKVQTLQAQINEEVVKSRKLIEDNNAIQMHRQQFEMRLTQADEVKETMEQEIRSLTEQLDSQKNIIVHQQYDLTQKDDLIKQLEETQLDMERHVNLHMMQDNEMKTEISQLKSACQQHVEEIRRLELSKNQSLGDLKVQQEEYETNISQLNQELKKVKDEKQEIEISRDNEAMEEKKTQVKIKNLQNELSSQLAIAERLQSELEEQKVKNNDLRKKNWKVMEALNEAENRIKKQAKVKFEADIAAAVEQENLRNKKLLQRLFPNFVVDDDLPHDEWIRQMEKSIRNYVSDLERPKRPEPVDNSEVINLQMQIQKNKESLDEYDNLLNELQKRTAETEMEWQKEIDKKNVELEVKNKTLKEKDDRISSMEKEIGIIKDQLQQTEDGQSDPEIQAVQFAYECIEKSLPAIIDELHLQLSDLETQLLAEKEINQRLTNDNALILKQESKPQNDSTIQVERLQEEINRMSEQLLEEQRINKELKIQIETISNLSTKTINHSNTSNGPSVTVEKLLSSTSSAASSVNEVLIKKTKKKKKPKKNNENQ